MTDDEAYEQYKADKISLSDCLMIRHENLKQTDEYWEMLRTGRLQGQGGEQRIREAEQAKKVGVDPPSAPRSPDDRELPDFDEASARDVMGYLAAHPEVKAPDVVRYLAAHL